MQEKNRIMSLNVEGNARQQATIQKNPQDTDSYPVVRAVTKPIMYSEDEQMNWWRMREDHKAKYTKWNWEQVETITESLRQATGQRQEVR